MTPLWAVAAARIVMVGAATGLVLLAGPAPAATASYAFAAGQWLDAAALGAKSADFDDRIAAARGAATAAAYTTRDKAEARRLLDLGLAHAGAAQTMAPGNSAARLQKAILIGYRAKLDRSPGGARQSRQLLEAVLKAEPDNALANAVLGGWHGESIVTLGSFVAGTLVGAKREQFIAHSDKALAADAASVVYPVFYAFTLLALDKGQAAKARALLQRSARGSPADAYDALIQGKGRRVLKLLEAGDTASAQALAARLSAFAQLG